MPALPVVQAERYPESSLRSPLTPSLLQKADSDDDEDSDDDDSDDDSEEEVSQSCVRLHAALLHACSRCNACHAYPAPDDR